MCVYKFVSNPIGFEYKCGLNCPAYFFYFFFWGGGVIFLLVFIFVSHEIDLNVINVCIHNCDREF